MIPHPPLLPAGLLVCLSKCRKLLSNAAIATERRWVNSLSLDIHTLSKMILHLDGYIVESTGCRNSCAVYERGIHSIKNKADIHRHARSRSSGPSRPSSATFMPMIVMAPGHGPSGRQRRQTGRRRCPMFLCCTCLPLSPTTCLLCCLRRPCRE